MFIRQVENTFDWPLGDTIKFRNIDQALRFYILFFKNHSHQEGLNAAFSTNLPLRCGKQRCSTLTQNLLCFVVISTASYVKLFTLLLMLQDPAQTSPLKHCPHPGTAARSALFRVPLFKPRTHSVIITFTHFPHKTMCSLRARPSIFLTNQ